jgi:SAM-dependent methyltransferase
LDEQFGPQGDKYNTGSGYIWAHKYLASKAKYAFPFSAYNVPQLGKFDVVYFMGVLYHLAHPMLAIEQINKALNLGGIMVLETEAHATTHSFYHQTKNPRTNKTHQSKGLFYNFFAFIKLFPRNPVRTMKTALFYIQLLMRTSIEKLGINCEHDYITDPTVITVPSIKILEKMIDFGGFSIEKATIRAHRVVYHCKKVSEVNGTFAGMAEQSKPEITNIPSLLNRI